MIMNKSDLFTEDNTILLINKNKVKFNNHIQFDKAGNYNLLILNNNKLDNLKNLFKDCKEINKIKFYKINTENVTNMEYMFYGCSSLTSLDVTKFNTKNVTNICFMVVYL